MSASQYTVVTMRLDSFKLVTDTQHLDDGHLHCKFDPVKGYEPNDILAKKSDYITIKPSEKNTYQYPDDTDPTTRDSSNLGEAPVTIGSEMSWATQNAPRSMNEGHSMKKNLCTWVMKIRACEMMMTWR